MLTINFVNHLVLQSKIASTTTSVYSRATTNFRKAGA